MKPRSRKFAAIPKAISLARLAFGFSLLGLQGNVGAQWVQSGLTGNTIQAFVVSGPNLYAGTYDKGIFLSTNNGANWTAINKGLTDAVLFALAVSGTNLFAGTAGSGVFLSTNNGTSWTVANSGLAQPNLNVYALAVSGANCFAGANSGVFLSTDYGTSWTAVNTGLTGHVVQTLAVNGTNLFAGTAGGGVFLSTNNGTSWTAVNSGLTESWILSIAIIGTNVFVGTLDSGIFLSTNNGISWATINTGLININVPRITTLAVSGTNLFAGAGGGGVCVYLSTDNGTSWSAVNSGLIPTIIDMKSLVASGQNLYAGTYNHGVWRRPLSEMISASNNFNVVDANAAGAVESLVDGSGNIVKDVNKFDAELTDSKSIVQGAIADGVSNLAIIAKSSQALTFSLSAGHNDVLHDPILGASSSSGSITIQPQKASNGDYIVSCIYQAPDGIGQTTNLSKTIPLTITNSDGSIFGSASIMIEKPPVVLVHGLWSNPTDAWYKSGFFDYLFEQGFIQYVADYSKDNYATSSFDPRHTGSAGINSVKGAIHDALKSVHDQQLAGSQVDVLGHSMGGLMARSFMQQSDYKSQQNYLQGSIRRLITIGTPHHGSPVAPLLVANQSLLVVLPDLSRILLSILLAAAHHPIGDCISELTYSPKSQAYQDISISNVHSHAIVGTWTPYDIYDNAIYSALYTITLGEPAPLIFGNEWNSCDLVVGESSQSGGLSGKDTTEIHNVIHAPIAIDPLGLTVTAADAETSNSTIQSRTSYLLGSDLSEGLFSSSFPKPTIREKNEPISPLSELGNPVATGYIKITSPLPNSIFREGDTMTVALEGVGNDSIASMVVIIAGEGIDTLPISRPYQRDFIISSDHEIGNHTILVLARDVNGGLLGDTVSVNYQTYQTLQGIIISPSAIQLTDSISSVGISVIGKYQSDTNNIYRDLSSTTTGTTYLTQHDSSVVRMSSVGVVSAVHSGSDVVSVIQGLDTGYVNVTVNISSASVKNSASTASAPSFSVYPNPSSSYCNLVFELGHSSPVSITIYDALGRIVATPVVGEMESAGQHEASFDAQNLPPGVYSCRLSAGDAEMIAKMVVVR